MKDFIKLPSDNYFTSSHPIKAVVLHGTAGPAAAALSWLRYPNKENPDLAVSANYLVDKAGRIYELVDFRAGRRAWANGRLEHFDTSIKWLLDAYMARLNPNLITVSIEHEASSREMETHASMTDAQFNSSIDLTAFILKTCNLVANHETVIGHNQISGIQKYNCPGVIFPPAYTEVLLERYPALG